MKGIFCGVSQQWAKLKNVVLRTRHYFCLLHRGLCQLSPLQNAEGCSGISKTAAAKPRISVTKRSQFFKKAEVQTKAFELSLPRIPLFCASASLHDGKLWYTLIKLRGNFQPIFHCRFFGTHS
jgi:hypothetical protein